VGEESAIPVIVRWARPGQERDQTSQIRASRKSVMPRTRQDRDAQPTILQNRNPGIVEADDHLRRNRIATLRPVKGHDCDVVMFLEQQLRHLTLLCASLKVTAGGVTVCDMPRGRGPRL